MQKTTEKLNTEFFYNYLADLKAERKREAIQLNIDLKKIKQVQTVFIKKVNHLLTDIFKKTMSYEKLLKKTISTNKTVEETLLHVYTAIRQNEYLQAKYPTQDGKGKRYVGGRYKDN